MWSMRRELLATPARVVERSATIRQWDAEAVERFFLATGCVPVARALRSLNVSGPEIDDMNPHAWQARLHQACTEAQLRTAFEFVTTLKDASDPAARHTWNEIKRRTEQAFHLVEAWRQNTIGGAAAAAAAAAGAVGVRPAGYLRTPWTIPAFGGMFPRPGPMPPPAAAGPVAPSPSPAAAAASAAASASAATAAAASAAASSTSITYPLELFVDPNSVQDLLCDMPNCGDVVSNPPFMNCQHKYCGACIAGWAAKTCPLCRESYESLGGRPNKQLIGLIAKKRVRCVHYKLGCEAEMEIGHENKGILAHRVLCTFEPIICALCSERVPRVLIDNHRATSCSARPILCTHCDQQVPARDMKCHKQTTQDRVSGDWTPCNSSVMCATRCRDEKGLIRIFKPTEIAAHEAACKRRVRQCAMCPPYEQHSLPFDELERHYRSKITSLDHALQVLLMQTFAEPRPPASTGATSPSRRAAGENLRDLTMVKQPDSRTILTLDGFHEPSEAGGLRRLRPASAAPSSGTSSPVMSPLQVAASLCAPAAHPSAASVSAAPSIFGGESGMHSPLKRAPAMAWGAAHSSFPTAPILSAAASSSMVEPLSAPAAYAAPSAATGVRHFTASLRAGSAVEVFSKSSNQWKLATVTAIDPLVIYAKAADGKKYTKPRQSDHIRAPPLASPTSKKRKHIVEMDEPDEEAADDFDFDASPMEESVPRMIREYSGETEEAKQAREEEAALQQELSDTSDEPEPDDSKDDEAMANSAVAAAAVPRMATTTAQPLTEREFEKWARKLKVNSLVDYFDSVEYRCWRLGRVVEIDQAGGSLVVKPGSRFKRDRKEDPVAFSSISSAVLAKPRSRSTAAHDKLIEQAERRAQKRPRLNDAAAAFAAPSTATTAAALPPMAAAAMAAAPAAMATSFTPPAAVSPIVAAADVAVTATSVTAPIHADASTASVAAAASPLPAPAPLAPSPVASFAGAIISQPAAASAAAPSPSLSMAESPRPDQVALPPSSSGVVAPAAPAAADNAQHAAAMHDEVPAPFKSECSHGTHFAGSDEMPPLE